MQLGIAGIWLWKYCTSFFSRLFKVWFADNRVSIEHHEAGQKHKAAVQAKLRELAKQNKEKERAVSPPYFLRQYCTTRSGLGGMKCHYCCDKYC